MRMHHTPADARGIARKLIGRFLHQATARHHLKSRARSQCTRHPDEPRYNRASGLFLLAVAITSRLGRVWGP